MVSKVLMWGSSVLRVGSRVLLVLLFLVFSVRLVLVKVWWNGLVVLCVLLLISMLMCFWLGSSWCKNMVWWVGG